ncbi:hypothetical protein TWF718_005173 [Orbilia javanica]|uniref:Uncharacterized protein n=1 Tax=Orbilia javanica TaxID=47235 RepID=A0AAN8MWG6_9PEZI
MLFLQLLGLLALILASPYTVPTVDTGFFVPRIGESTGYEYRTTTVETSLCPGQQNSTSVSAPETLSSLEHTTVSTPETLSSLEHATVSVPETLNSLEQNSVSIPETLNILEQNSVSVPETLNFMELGHPLARREQAAGTLTLTIQFVDLPEPTLPLIEGPKPETTWAPFIEAPKPAEFPQTNETQFFSGPTDGVLTLTASEDNNAGSNTNALTLYLPPTLSNGLASESAATRTLTVIEALGDITYAQTMTITAAPNGNGNPFADFGKPLTISVFTTVLDTLFLTREPTGRPKGFGSVDQFPVLPTPSWGAIDASPASTQAPESGLIFSMTAIATEEPDDLFTRIARSKATRLEALGTFSQPRVPRTMLRRGVQRVESLLATNEVNLTTLFNGQPGGTTTGSPASPGAAVSPEMVPMTTPSVETAAKSAKVTTSLAVMGKSGLGTRKYRPYGMDLSPISAMYRRTATKVVQFIKTKVQKLKTSLRAVTRNVGTIPRLSTRATRVLLLPVPTTAIVTESGLQESHTMDPEYLPRPSQTATLPSSTTLLRSALEATLEHLPGSITPRMLYWAPETQMVPPTPTTSSKIQVSREPQNSSIDESYSPRAPQPSMHVALLIPRSTGTTEEAHISNGSSIGGPLQGNEAIITEFKLPAAVSPVQPPHLPTLAFSTSGWYKPLPTMTTVTRRHQARIFSRENGTPTVSAHKPVASRYARKRMPVQTQVSLSTKIISGYSTLFPDTTLEPKQTPQVKFSTVTLPPWDGGHETIIICEPAPTVNPYENLSHIRITPDDMEDLMARQLIEPIGADFKAGYTDVVPWVAPSQTSMASSMATTSNASVRLNTATSIICSESTWSVLVFFMVVFPVFFAVVMTDIFIRHVWFRGVPQDIKNRLLADKRYRGFERMIGVGSISGVSVFIGTLVACYLRNGICEDVKVCQDLVEAGRHF